MNQSQVSITGNVATPVHHAVTASGKPVADFRLACTPRRRDKEQGGWVDAPTTFVTVTSFGSLAMNVASSLGVGDPVVVTGRLEIKDSSRDGRTYRDAIVYASALGHDLTRGSSAFTRTPRAAADSDRSAPGASGASGAPGAVADTAA
jgi:single-strand DNA-binding protein